VEFSANKETSLREYLKIVFRQKYVIITVVIVVMLSVIIRAQLRTPLYTASVKMTVVGYYKEREGDYLRKMFSARTVIAANAEMVKSKAVIERVVKTLKLYQRPIDEEKTVAPPLRAYLLEKSTKALEKKLDNMKPDQRTDFLVNNAISSLSARVSAVQLEDESLFFVVTVSDINPVAAVVIANAVASSFVIYDLERQLKELQYQYGEKHESVVMLQNNIQNMLEKLGRGQIPDIEEMGPATINIIEQAQEASGGAEELSKFKMLATFLMSLFFGGLVAIGFDYADPTLKSPNDIERHINIPFLGSIPRKKGKDRVLIADSNLKITDYTISYQKLSDQIYLLIRTKNIKSLLLASVEHSEETPVVIANIGIYLSHKLGHKVLIIDADHRESLLAKIFNISNGPGLHDILEGKISFNDAVQDLGYGLYVLPAGETVFNPSTLFDSSAMADLIKDAKDKYDIVLINCANMKNFMDATIISSFSEGVIIVIDDGKERRHIVKSAVAQFEKRKVHIIGGILNNRKYVIPDLIYRIT
jgi:capsular exopolysaccharide synthesis family protein